jgi:exosortase C (VPDSG-CTERM-specific)
MSLDKSPVGASGFAANAMAGKGASDPARARRQFWIAAGVLTLGFTPWLLTWARFAANDGLASYVLGIPFVSAWLIWRPRGETPEPTGRATRPALIATVIMVILLGLAILTRTTAPATRYDFLTPMILAYIAGLVACAFLTVGRSVVRHHAFAIGFLAFAAPLPSWAVNGLEIFFQHTSAEVAAWMMQWAQIPTLRSGLVFQLPGITIQVAQECSGIRSSVVLFIVSVYGGYLILQRPARRWLLALFVIPLGIVRNGFRILTIAALCTHVGSHMINSPIHHSGGPLFFALSLIPLFLFLLWLRRGERKSQGKTEQTASASEPVRDKPPS